MVAMRASLTTIQQTLTPEAVAVLNRSIAEASKRCHGQTTPLHVAATLLASPSGFLRQACIRSHPNSSHPLQCRALELCFSVALERLPTAAGDPPPPEPPISNALMAALKRAQAHQRRGCPEQQQQPLLAVKVELEQLIISILDDPSVSRVMREASFSSPAVKAAIEQSLITTSSSSPSSHHSSSFPSSSLAAPKICIGFRPMGPTPSPSPMSGRSPYLNPRLQNQHGIRPNPGNSGGQSGGDDVRKVIEILSRKKRKNPVLVGESETEFVLKEVLRRIEKRELVDVRLLSNVEIVSVEKEQGLARLSGSARLKELGGLIERRRMCMSGVNGGLILDLGDLKWMVDQPPSFGVQHQGVSEAPREAVAEMGKILGRFNGGAEGIDGGGRIWVIGTATCETFMKCQVYYPTMENEWDIQAVSIVARAPLQSTFPRSVMNGILKSSSESFSPLKNLPNTTQTLAWSDRNQSQNLGFSGKPSCCPQCLQNYQQEVEELSAGKSENPVSDDKSEATQKQLPQWLQNATVRNKTLDSSQTKDQDPFLKKKSEELMKKWSDKCLLLHPSFHQNGSLEKSNPTPLPLTSPNLLRRQPFQPKTQQTRTLGDDLSLSMNSLTSQPAERLQPPPGSLVRTDLVLGPTNIQESTGIEKSQKDLVKDLLGCISPRAPSKVSELQGDEPSDVDSFKKLLKGLIEKVWWQRDAASAVAATVTQCKMGNGRQRANGAKGDIWMLFSGPDRTGKKKMATALSERVGGTAPIIICLGSRRDGEELDMNFRGKTVLDRVAEAVRRNPFSVIMLQDIDEADMLVQGSIRRAMERGWFTDSYGREVRLGNIIFILTVNKWSPSSHNLQLDEEKLASIVSDSWQLKLTVCNQKGGKRHPSWLIDEEERALKQRREMGGSVPFDLNETADAEEDKLDGSHNSSDLTVEHEEEKGHENRFSPTTTSAPRELLTLVDEAIVFKPVEFALIRQNVESTIMARFHSVLGEKLAVRIESEALDRILGGTWLGNTGLDSWVEKVLAPSIHQLKSRLPMPMASSEETTFARLELDHKLEADREGALLPSRIMVSVSGEEIRS